tara:strand:+ start:15221 stop:15475 length:255 start_codon:yes stop_codon:yes gene_type:complete
MDKLIIALLRGDYGDTGFSYDGATVYELVEGHIKVIYWNSSNRQEPWHKEVHEAILEEVENDHDKWDGSVSINMNEIMFEIQEI